MNIPNFDSVVEHLNKRKKPVSLLMGNGFSMAYDRDIFLYNPLYDSMASRENELLKTLFGVIETRNFFLVMQQLGTTLALLDAFGSDASLREKNSAGKPKVRIFDTKTAKVEVLSLDCLGINLGGACGKRPWCSDS